jgi:hypothetical protein
MRTRDQDSAIAWMAHLTDDSISIRINVSNQFIFMKAIKLLIS